MRVFIAGMDGYLGWTLAMCLTAKGHDVAGADCFLRRDWVEEMGSHSAVPIAGMATRQKTLKKVFGRSPRFYEGDLTDYGFLAEALRDFKPDALVHLGEMPSAPYSMIDVGHAVRTHVNNLSGTLNMLFVLRDHLPDCHLVKLGTMGEFGTPNVDIPEGDFELEYRGRKDTLPFPKQPGSFYHATKCHDSVNVRCACKWWGLHSTDVMQGVVYGTRVDEMFCEREVEDLEVDGAGAFADLRTRLDFDQCFGTAVNRFCAQAAVGEPITPYGRGRQKRGFLPLRDSMQCLALVIENPPDRGEYRAFNQFEEVYGIAELAGAVVHAAKMRGVKATVRDLCNPRAEAEGHYYNPDREKLRDLGYVPGGNMRHELTGMIDDLHMHRDRIIAKRGVLIPDVRWSGVRKPMEYRKGKK